MSLSSDEPQNIWLVTYDVESGQYEESTLYQWITTDLDRWQQKRPRTSDFLILSVHECRKEATEHIRSLERAEL